MFDSLLIANRGEIACRVIRTARRLGLRTIAVYSEADRGALHVRLADEAVCIGPAAARESYLNVARILEAARQTGAESIHPGYGFLAENAAFASACAQAEVVFIGPPPDAIVRMGSKSEARRLMSAAGVPVLPGYDDDDQADATLARAARKVGFPLLIKPTAGGGGKGMRIVREAGELAEALAGARREALKAFGDDRVLLERFVEKGRHVEIQVFADSLGNAVHLFERDCSLQRRHQKVIEEAPAPGLSDATRDAMGAAAVAAARAVGYQGAGTVEFLYDGREFFFLEMNTRLQVEHPVTELITGLDLVEWQLRVASGEPLPLPQHEIQHSGHAVEARLYAEDPERGFLPSTGVLARLRLPEGLPGVRVDAGVQQGDEVSVHYDPMIAKLIAWAPDRLGAIDRLRDALEHTAVDGVRTNARFLWEILGADAVRAGDVSTRLLEQALQPVAGVPEAEATDAWLIAAAAAVQRMPGDAAGVAHAAASPWQAATGFRMNSPATIRVALRLGDKAHWLEIKRDDKNPHPGSAGPLPQAGEVRSPLPFTGEVARSAGEGDLLIEFDGKTHRVALRATNPGHVAGTIDGRPVSASCDVDHDHVVLRRQCLRFDFQDDTGAEHRASAEHEGHFRAPMPGHVLDVRVTEGDTVKSGAVLMVLEAMKMEHSLMAPWDGLVAAVHVKAGDRVEEGADLLLLQPATEC
jgi:3-methylcrotonyl-CoA carboxylase alpha subunit